MGEKSPKSDAEKIAALQAHIVGLERKNRTLRMALRQRERRQKHPPRPWGDEKQAEAPRSPSPGRWAWLLRDIQVFRPRAGVTGRQGFFDLPQGWMTDV
jgi:hypothetical protein